METPELKALSGDGGFGATVAPGIPIQGRFLPQKNYEKLERVCVSLH